ncbi:hypothetical protein G6F42_023551 [Rhizopus arrhizus]|nr:hypothetical protein G6F42_023551 [Rhizopus arrhizus]
MQILELLFKAYYVDDEVFRSLDNAAAAGDQNKNNHHHQQQQQFGVATPGTQASANPFFASTEKLSPYQQKEDQNGFSHMFSERQSRGSISSDANSQVNLHSAQDVHLRDMR